MSTELQISLTLSLSYPTVWWDSGIIHIPIPSKDKNRMPSASQCGWDGERKDRAKPAMLPISRPNRLSWKVRTHPQYLWLIAGGLCYICQTSGTTMLSLISFDHQFLAENDSIMSNQSSVPNLGEHQNHLECLWKHKLLAPLPEFLN